MEFSHGKLATHISHVLLLHGCEMLHTETSCGDCYAWHADSQTQAGDGGAIQAVQACAQ